MQKAGAKVITLPYADWWSIICEHKLPGVEGMYVDAVCNPAAMPGNATIGLEILQDLPEVDTIIVPFGGGGVSCGIASAIRALKPDTRVIAAESELSTPFSSALEAGKVVTVKSNPGFISGIGGLSMLHEMWPLASSILDGSVVSPVAAVADAVRILFEYNRVVAEGAGAASLAGALTIEADGPIVCVITGGNIDKAHMATILAGGIPDTV
jgi:threonine dehydratase